MGPKLEDKAETLLRQVHPNFIEEGVPSSQTFQPSPKDKDRLSVDRQSLVTPADSYAAFLSTGFKSAAVYGITVVEFEAENISCHADPIAPVGKAPGNSAHALADYSGHSKSQQKVVAKRLKRKALARGCLFTPE
jgi:hypothetical protein